KIIIIRDGMVSDFGMNTVCAAGTGSFLDHQAARLRISIEELSRRALLADKAVPVAGRCTVFAESEMVHKQQAGHAVDGIIYGLCRALVRNFLNDVASGKDIRPPVVFQGGVAFNRGIVRALREELRTEIIVPPHHEVLGAVGAALLVHEAAPERPGRFRGFDICERDVLTSSRECRACPSACEIVEVKEDDRIIGTWGGRCELWEKSPAVQGE
ncbi:MAG: 2-hydroxyglutaryl-CoA dehydratase, partial [Chloroflexi bacterium RBG_16_56_11]